MSTLIFACGRESSTTTRENDHPTGQINGNFGLNQRRRERWPDLNQLNVRYRGSFAYITATTSQDSEPMPLFRLRYLGSADQWGFAIYLASKDGYEDSILPHGSPIGTPEQALDCACGLYLNDPTARAETLTDHPLDTRENFR